MEGSFEDFFEETESKNMSGLEVRSPVKLYGRIWRDDQNYVARRRSNLFSGGLRAETFSD